LPDGPTVPTFGRLMHNVSAVAAEWVQSAYHPIQNGEMTITQPRVVRLDEIVCTGAPKVPEAALKSKPQPEVEICCQWLLF